MQAAGRPQPGRAHSLGRDMSVKVTTRPDKMVDTAGRGDGAPRSGGGRSALGRGDGRADDIGEYLWVDPRGWSYRSRVPPLGLEPSAEAEDAERTGSPATLGDAALGYLVGILCSVALGTVAFLVFGEDADLAITAASLVGLWIGLLWAVRRASTRRGTGSIVRDFGVRITWGDLGLGLLGGIGV